MHVDQHVVPFQGGLEFVSKATTINDPFYTARPSNFPPNLRGVQVMAVDILPSEVPLDASEHFSQALLPYVRALIRQEQERRGVPTTEDIGEEAVDMLAALNRATIAENGKLTRSHRWLYEPLRDVNLVSPPSSHSSASIHPSSSLSYSRAPVARNHTSTVPKVLLFGSGMVAKPFCQTIWNYGHENGHVNLTVASNNIADASALVRGHEGQGASAVEIDIANVSKVEALVKSADIVARYASH